MLTACVAFASLPAHPDSRSNTHRFVEVRGAKLYTQTFGHGAPFYLCAAGGFSLTSAPSVSLRSTNCGTCGQLQAKAPAVESSGATRELSTAKGAKTPARGRGRINLQQNGRQLSASATSRTLWPPRRPTRGP